MKFFKKTRAKPKERIFVLKINEKDLKDIEKLRKALNKKTVGEVLVFALKWLWYTLFEVLLEEGAIIIKHPKKGEMMIKFSPEEIQRIKFDPEETFWQIEKFEKFFGQLNSIPEEGNQNADN